MKEIKISITMDRVLSTSTLTDTVFQSSLLTKMWFRLPGLSMIPCLEDRPRGPSIILQEDMGSEEGVGQGHEVMAEVT